MPRLKDLTGRRFGRLVVLGRAANADRSARVAAWFHLGHLPTRVRNGAYDRDDYRAERAQ